ncbi:cupin domain-containing protein [Dyella sp. GSA-30]|uniref:JmjC domain-containing protein n=1 Tax=Dyella sp. GSA-30 TaxID=2994496 RepID=UPI0024923AA2|nr:cupin domain-containing protein [Dyella sp. GSA-30]
MSLIERFFTGTTLQEFLSRYWLHESLYVSASLSRLPEIAENPLFLSPADALHMKCGEYRVDKPDQNGKNLVSQAFGASQEEALISLRQGRTVYMGGLSEEPLPQFANALDTELDLPVVLPAPVLERFWLAFAAKPSYGLRWHWDRHHLFILQVAGRKSFRIAKNQYFDRPTVPPTGYDSWRKGMDPSLCGALGLTSIPASQVPHTYTELELSAGDCLFLPAGTWHSAATIEDSLHLAYAVKVPTLPEFLLQSLTLLHETYAARFHVPIASSKDLMSLCDSGDASNGPLHSARRAWFACMEQATGVFAQGGDFGAFMRHITSEVARGTFSMEGRE